MIGATYQGPLMGAFLGPLASDAVPETMYGAYLDSGLTVLGETGAAISRSGFEVLGDVAKNTGIIEGGVVPAGTIAYFALTDAETGGAVVFYGPVDMGGTSEGDAVVFQPGDLTLGYADPA